MKCKIKLMSSDKRLSYSYSARDDYLRGYINDYDCILSNKKWRVMPCLVITKNDGPTIMTCRNHNKGTNKMYIHPPRSPHNHALSSKQGDKLCQVVNKTRTISPMKAAQYSNTYQMHEQRGSFQGVDTCDVTDIGDFSFTSVFLDESESLFALTLILKIFPKSL